MAVVELMTWVQSRNGWMKDFGGKMHSRSCRQLRKDFPDLVTADTEKGSLRAANEWWRKRQAELEGSPQSRYEAALDARPELRQLVADHQKTLRAINRTGIDLEQLSPQERLRLQKTVFENVDLINEAKPSTEKAIKHHIEAFRTQAQKDVEATIIKAGRYVKISNSLDWLIKYVDDDTRSQSITDISQIDESFLKDYFRWLKAQQAKKAFGVFHRSGHWQVFRKVVEDLATRHLILMPVNLWSKDFKIKLPKLVYRYWTAEEFNVFYSAAVPRTKLFLLLAANCGFYDSDMGKLLKSEINWKAGTITRQRSKTGDELDEDHHVSSSGVPVVTWYLWPETLKLLKDHLSEHPTLALTDEKGGVLWEDGIRPEGHPKAGKYFKNDNIRTAFFRLSRTKTIREQIEDLKNLTIESLRKTSAQFLSDSQYKDCADMFGDWSPKSIRERSYTTVTQAQFKEACLWLRSCYL